MPEDDPFPGRVHGDPRIADEGGAPLASDEVQEARWRTASVAVPVDVVRNGLARTLTRGKALPGLSVEGVATRDGFILNCRAGKRRIGAELKLLGWEEGTQVHLVVPAEAKVTERELKRLFGWLELVFAENAWRVE